MKVRIVYVIVLVVIGWSFLVCCGTGKPPERPSEPASGRYVPTYGKDPVIRRKPERENVPDMGLDAAEARREQTPVKTVVVSPPKPKKQKVKRPITHNMVFVEGGNFTMGYSDPGLPETGPQQEVHLEDFHIDKYEVTNAQFKEFIKETGYEWKGNLNAWNGPLLSDELASHPVTYVSWFDAAAYAKWVGKRLPTEAEWEKAARGIDGRAYPWGNEFSQQRCNVQESGKDTTVPVTSYPDGISPYGCHNMCGNVAEWTASWYEAYPNSSAQVIEFGQQFKALRGGSFFHKTGIRTFERSYDKPDIWVRNCYGFRCAFSANKVEKEESHEPEEEEETGE